ncbi:MAG TPA: DUF222 domain-containing protein [Vicinamibacteria bacterium]|nr:DUF222 domain-containing protein [Vicinamibacteria bacterium]
MTPYTIAAPARAERLSAPGPGAPADVDALGDEIARLSAHMHAAEYRLLTLLRVFDEREGWGAGGFRSCAHWLSWRTGLSPGPAREKVRVARALAHLPLIGARMERGQFSYSKVRALTRVATSENQAELIHFAEHATVAQVERLVRGWRRVDELEARAEEPRHARRSLGVFPDEDGMYVVRGRLDPEVGSLLMKALEVAGRELYRSDPDASAAQRRADALGEILRRGGAPAVHALLHVTRDGGAHTEEGVRVSAETSERLTCDAHVTEVERGASGEGAVGAPDAGANEAPDVARLGANEAPDAGRLGRNDVLDVGRRRRTVPARMRRALEVRDGGRCRFPGCESRRCDAHHVRHWSRGGETNLENLVLLCRFHHRLVHEGRYRVELRRRGGDGGDGRCVTTVRFRRPDGREVPDHPRIDPVGEHALERWHAQGGIDHKTTLVRGMGGPVDYGWALEALRAS